MSFGVARKSYKASMDDDDDNHELDERDPDSENLLPMDEQEQEELIEDLRKQDEDRNNFFKFAFTCLAAFPSVFHFVRLYYGNFDLFDFLSLSSLMMTIFTLRGIPVNYAPRDARFFTPTQKLIPYLNPLLVFIITINAGLKSKTKFDHDRDFWFLPLVVWVIMLAGRRIMSSTDVDELEKLKYKYKGA